MYVHITLNCAIPKAKTSWQPTQQKRLLVPSDECDECEITRTATMHRSRCPPRDLVCCLVTCRVSILVINILQKHYNCYDISYSMYGSAAMAARGAGRMEAQRARDVLFVSFGDADIKAGYFRTFAANWFAAGDLPSRRLEFHTSVIMKQRCLYLYTLSDTFTLCSWE